MTRKKEFERANKWKKERERMRKWSDFDFFDDATVFLLYFTFFLHLLPTFHPRYILFPQSYLANAHAMASHQDNSNRPGSRNEKSTGGGESNKQHNIENKKARQPSSF